MQKIGSQLRFLELKQTLLWADNVMVAKSFFSSMPQLETLKLDRVLFNYDGSTLAEGEAVNLKNLKTIVINGDCSDVSII